MTVLYIPVKTVVYIGTALTVCLVVALILYFNRPSTFLPVPFESTEATIQSCEFLDHTKWKSEYVKSVYWNLIADKYPVRSEFIRDFSATDSDLLPLAECLWEWYIQVWRWNGKG